MNQKHKLMALMLILVAVFAVNANAEPWKFVIYGDARPDNDDRRDLLESIVENTPDYRFIINVGDVIEDGTIKSQWDEWQDACDDILGDTGQTNVPPEYMVVPGDQDNTESEDGMKNWRKYLRGQQRFGNNGAFFVFDYENARFIVLNSNASITGSQLEMLYDAIDSNKKKWLFALWHQPIFSFGEDPYHDVIHDNWGIPLYWGGCDIIFTGHDNYFARSEKLELNGQSFPFLDRDCGTVQIITGNGGVPFYDISALSSEYMMAELISDTGYTELTIDGDILQLHHIDIDGNVVDEEIYTPNPKAGIVQDNGITANPEKFSENTKENAFDGDINTRWLTLGSSGWIQYDYVYDGGTAKVVNGYRITSTDDFPERDPRDWSLTASNDGKNWTVLDKRSNEIFPSRYCTRTFTFENLKGFRMYRFEISSNNDPLAADSIQLAEIELLEKMIIDNPPDDPSKIVPDKCEREVTEETIVRHELAVVNGSGEGMYRAGRFVTITAEAAPKGKIFDRWAVDSGRPCMADIKASSTDLKMGTGAVKVTARYKDAPPARYSLTVGSGSGGGRYKADEKVEIKADSPPKNKVFEGWVVDSGSPCIADIKALSTSLKMGTGAVKVTARYKDAPPEKYTLKVTDGSGEGSYICGEEVDITAQKAPSGKEFDHWVVNAGSVEIYDAEATTTILKMGEGPVRIAAVYRDLPNAACNLKVIGGIGSGGYGEGEVVTISADTAPIGKVFDRWVISSGRPRVAVLDEPITSLIIHSGDATVMATYSMPGLRTPIDHSSVAKYDFDSYEDEKTEIESPDIDNSDKDLSGNEGNVTDRSYVGQIYDACTDNGPQYDAYSNIGQSDVIKITNAEYKRSGYEVIVEAIHSDGGNETLTVEGYGKMRYDESSDKYILVFKQHRRDPPREIKVISSGGVYVTAPIKGVTRR